MTRTVVLVALGLTSYIAFAVAIGKLLKASREASER